MLFDTKTIACRKLDLKELCLAAVNNRWQQWDVTKALKLAEKQWGEMINLMAELDMWLALSTRVIYSYFIVIC